MAARDENPPLQWKLQSHHTNDLVGTFWLHSAVMPTPARAADAELANPSRPDGALSRTLREMHECGRTHSPTLGV